MSVWIFYLRCSFVFNFLNLITKFEGKTQSYFKNFIFVLQYFFFINKIIFIVIVFQHECNMFYLKSQAQNCLMKEIDVFLRRQECFFKNWESECCDETHWLMKMDVKFALILKKYLQKLKMQLCFYY